MSNYVVRLYPFWLGESIMSDLKDFNWTGFWNDVDYAFESYIGKPVTDDDIKEC